jgi:alkylhydroperoxidase family enzyme
MKYHAAVAAELLGSEELVRGAIHDLETSALPEKEKALLRFVNKVNHRAWKITAEDMKALYAAGWTDEAIYYAITVCSLFNFFNRWIDATGVHAMSEEAHQEFGKRTARQGYIPK